MRITTREPKLRAARSNAFDVLYSNGGNPISNQYGLITVPMPNCNIALDEGRFDLLSNFVINEVMSSNFPDERLVFVDLETAGLEPWRPIIQIAAIAVDSRLRELERFEAKIRFNKQFASSKSLCKASYSPQKWKREGQPAGEVMKQFTSLLRRHATVDQTSAKRRVFNVAQLVAHNGAFDGAFLSAWYDRFDSFLPASPRVFCTLQRAIWMFHEDKTLTPPPNFSLRTLCNYFGVSLSASEAHEALNDVRATVDLYRAISLHRQSRMQQPPLSCG